MPTLRRATGAAEMSTFTLAPRINHSFALDGGKTIEPFVTYKRQFDLGEQGARNGHGWTGDHGLSGCRPYVHQSQRLFAKRDDGSRRVEPPTTAESLNSKFQLKIPIQ